MTAPVLIICDNADTLAAKAADLIAQTGQDAIRQRGRFTLVPAGGSTPERTYRLLGQPGRSTLDWSKTYLFMGDERFVPPHDPNFNFGMVQRALLDHVSVPRDHVVPMPTDTRTPAEAAALYADTLARFFNIPTGGPPPRFDLILLGLGDDGHTLSLFPGAPALRVQDAWVTWSPPGTLPPPVDRITFTYPVLSAARLDVFLVSGQKKAAALRDVLEGQPSPDTRPAAGVRPTDGTVTWLVDRAAASLLKRQS